MMYSKRRSRKTLANPTDCGSSVGAPRPRAERRERRVIHASLSHSEKARESSVAEFEGGPPARAGEEDCSMERRDRRMRSMDDWKWLRREVEGRDSGLGSSKLERAMESISGGGMSSARTREVE